MKHSVVMIGLFFGLSVLSSCYDTSDFTAEKVRYVVTNNDRAEVLTDDPDDVRVFAVTVYYPSDKENGPVSSAEEKYPIMLFSSGYNGTIDNYPDLIQGMVEKGIIVAAMEHPYSDRVVKINGKKYKPRRKSPDDKEEDILQELLKMQETEAYDAIDAIDLLEEKNASDFNNKLDLDHIAYAGHSMGGMAATLSIRDGSDYNDPRIDAVISYDGVPWLHPDISHMELTKPFFYMASDTDWGDDLEDPEFDMSPYVYPLFNTAPAGNIIEIEDTVHTSVSSFCDNALIRIIGRVQPDYCEDKSIDRDRIHDIFDAYTYAFLMKYLKGEPQPLLDGASADYPEVDMLLVK